MTNSTLAVAPLSDLSIWLRSNLLIAVLLVLGTALFTRFATWLSRRFTDRIDARAQASDELARSEEAKHRHSMIQVATWSMLAILYCLVTVLVFKQLGFPLSSFVAPASVAGVALGFGAQRIVQDLLAGFLIVTERQYAYGDLVRLSLQGVVVAQGIVEEVTLRTTRLRTSDGEVVTTPNGQIVQVANLSRDWARAVVDVPLPVSVDVNHVSNVLREVCAQAFQDPELRLLLLDEPTVMGVEELTVDQVSVRVVSRTLPGRQFEVSRAMRYRLSLALLAEGITLPAGAGAG